MSTYQLQSTPLLQALCLCMLLANGGPAHHRLSVFTLQPRRIIQGLATPSPQKENRRPTNEATKMRGNLESAHEETEQSM
ncbi:hypothetical protein WJX82_004013 [Trebouxia sp. C0006]